jgi:hypothetical protein
LLSEGVGAVWGVLGSSIDGFIKLMDFAYNAFYRSIVASEEGRAAAGRLADSLMTLGASLLTDFDESGIAVGQPLVDSISRFSDAVGKVTSTLSDMISLVTDFQEALSFHFSINQAEIRRVAGDLLALGRDLSRDMLLVANVYTGQVQPAAKDFAAALSLTNGVMGDAWSLVSLFAEIVDAGGIQINLTDAKTLLASLYTFGNELSRALLANANYYSGSVGPNAKAFGEALSFTASVASDAWGLVSGLMEIFDAGGITITLADAVRVLDDLYVYGLFLADYLLSVANEYEGKVAPGAKHFAEALSLTNGVASDAWSLVSGLQDAFDAGGITISLSDAQTLLDDLYVFGLFLADYLLSVANTYANEVAPGAKNFADALSLTNSVAGDGWSLISGLMEAFKAGGVTISDTDAQALFGRILSLGQLLADQYLAVGNVYAGEVKDNARTFADALSVSNSASGDAMSFISDLQDFLKAGGVTISDADARTLLGNVLRLGVVLADGYLAVGNVYGGAVKDNARTFADALSVSNAASGDAMSMIGDLQDFLKAGGVTISEADARSLLASILAVGLALANGYLAVGNLYAGSVKDAAKTFADALGVSNAAIGDGIGLITELQDFVEAGGIGLDVGALEGILTSVAQAGDRLTVAFLAVANGYRGQVTDAARDFADALSVSNSAIGDGIGLIQELADYEPGEWNIEDLIALVGELAYDARQLAEKFVEVALGFNAAGNVAASDLADAIGSMSSGIGDALDTLPDLIKILPNYRGLTASMMTNLGTLLDDVVKVVIEFGRRAKAIDWKAISTEAMSNLSKGASDAWGAIGTTLDGIAKLFDPERIRMPSADQLSSMLDQILPLIKTAVLKVASLSSVIPAGDMKAAQDNAAAVGAVFDALSTTIQAIQDAVGLKVDSSGMNNLDEVMRWVSDLFKNVSAAFGEGSAAAAAMASISNILSNMGAFAGAAIGDSLIEALAASIRAGSDTVAEALGDMLGEASSGLSSGGNGGGGGRRFLPPGAGSGGTSTSSSSGEGPRQVNITIIQYVTPQIAADPAGTLIQIKDAMA